MKTSIEIQHRKLPREILSDFEKSIDKSISLKIYEDRLEHFDPPAEIVIYINEHLTEIIVGSASGVLASEVWSGIKLMWKKLTKQKKEDDSKRSDIELNFTIKPDRTLEFTLDGNVDPKHI